MRWCLYLCFVAVFLCNDASATDTALVVSAEQKFTVGIGETVTALLRRESYNGAGCYITSPDGLTREVNENTNYVDVSWGFRPTSTVACNITIGPITNDFPGRWTLTGYFVDEDVRIEARQPLRISIDAGITTLLLQEHNIYMGASVGIALSATGDTISCALRSPDGVEYSFGDENMPSEITTYYNANKYASCAVTIGPITESLLGEWTLIDQSSSGRIREQPALIQWANPTAPEELWQVTTAIERNIVTTIGSSVSVYVDRTEGFFQDCYLTTPDNVILPVYSRDYPGITFYRSTSVATCIVELGPIDSVMFGDWTLTARFDIDGVLTDVQQPIKIVASTGTTTLPRIRYSTNQGGYVDINLNQTGITGTCHVRNNNNQEYALSSAVGAGLTVQSSSQFVSCRVTIGPITEAMLGEWTIIERWGGLVREQPVTIAWANAEEPAIRQLLFAREQNIVTELGNTVSTSVDREDGIFEGCFLTTPDGAVLPVFSNTKYPGVALGRPNRYSGCVVEIGPVDTTMFGKWTLAAIYNNGGERIESQQPINIVQDDGITTLPTITHLTHIGTYIDINLNQTGVTGTCLLKSSTNGDHVLDSSFSLTGVTVHSSSKFVSCRVTIGPMTASLLGDWILIQQVPGQRERRQPVTIQWANSANPSLESRHINIATEQSTVSNFGDTVSVSTVWEDGFYESCFITSPDGTVLPVTISTRYPGVAYSRPISTASCTANLGPIDNYMTGTWTLAARFNNNGVLLETQQPFTISLNDVTDTVLPSLNFLTSTGGFVDINLSANSVADSCSLLTPNGELYNLDATFDLPGVTVHTGNTFIACGVTVSPVSEDLLGEWTLIEYSMLTVNRRRTVTIAWANPSDPSAEPSQLVIAAQQNSVIAEGGSYTVAVGREPGFDEGCFVITPDGITLPISEMESYPGIAWTFRPTTVSACSVQFGPLDTSLVGTWIVGARFNNGGVRVETHQPVHLALADGTTTLPLLEYLIHKDGFVDINLNQTGTTSSCSLRNPAGEEYALGTTSTLSGITVHSSNQIVSCRVTIGPMTDALLGQWTLIEQQASGLRLQPVSIAWINSANPTLTREVLTSTEQNIQTTVGSIVSTSVGRADGFFEGCFMTTPDGATLPVFPNTRYPGVEFVTVNSFATCVVQIGPAHTEMAGQWVLTAKFNNQGTRTQIQNVINFNLRDNLGVTILSRQTHVTNIGATIDISLSNNGVAGNCRLTTPAGREYVLDGLTSISGVTVRSNTSKFVSCSVSIGPMTEELLGDWVLAEEDSEYRLTQQPATISWANPQNPSDEVRQLIIAAQQNNVVDAGHTVNVAISREDGLSEGCFVTTPNGVVLPISDSISYPGVQWTSRPTSVTACTISFGPMDADMVGRWIVAARFNNGGTRVESQQPVNLVLGDGTTTLPLREYVSYLGGYIDVALNQTGNGGTCHLKNPAGDDFNLAVSVPSGVSVHSHSHFVSCRVTIGPMTTAMLGQWTLIEEHTDGTQRLQPVNIAWANPEDPSQGAREIITATDQYTLAPYGEVTSVHVERHESGQFEGCFITTPDGATLPIFPDNRYPGITYIAARSYAACVVELGPMDNNLVGNWILASRYNDGEKLIEIQQPIILDIGNAGPNIILILVLSVVGVLIILVGLVFACKKSRQWTSNKFSKLRSSFRSTNSKTDLVRDEHHDNHKDSPNVIVHQFPKKKEAA